MGTIVVGHVAGSSGARAGVQHHGQDERIREPLMVVRMDDGDEDRLSGPLRGVGGRTTEPAVSRVVAAPLLPSVAVSPARGSADPLPSPSENIRTRRLRRSPNVDNLRSSSIRTNSISDLSLNNTRGNRPLFGHGPQNPAIFASPIQFLAPAHALEPVQGLAPNPPVHGSSQNPTVHIYSPSGSVTVLQDHDVERIVRWRSTATTIDRGLTRSPISIRQFNSQEMLAWTHPNAPHVQVQHGSSMMDAGNSTGVQTAFQLPIPASGLSSPVRGEWDGGNGQSDGQLGFEEDWAGPGYYGLMEMNRVQWQVDTGIHHPELNFGNVGVESDRVRRVEDPEAMKEIDMGYAGKGKEPQKDQHDSKRASSSQSPRPILKKAQSTRERDPDPPRTARRVQIAPSSSSAAVHPILASALKDDAQTYTTEGLSLALTKLYDPAPIPSPVITALRDPDEIYTLDIQGIINSRHNNGAKAKIALNQKEIDYLTYYIDYLVSEKTQLEKAVYSLEERIEDVDVEKAGLQTEINHYFGLAEAEHNRLDATQQILRLIMSANNDGDYVNQKVRAMDMANELGVDLREVMRGTDIIGQKESARHVSNPMSIGESSKTKEMAGGAWKGKEPASEAGPSKKTETGAAASQREQLLEAEVKYRRKRTAVAEEFAKEMERVLFGRATASVLSDPMAMGEGSRQNKGKAKEKEMGEGSGAGKPNETEAEGGQREELLEAEVKYWKQRAAIAEEFVQEMEGVLFGRTTG
ncbi:hypothetical protein BCR34DRAFT_660118 [Clohesyomyces aquaticus]|uniref:Uncharacterized protein n=1 Tax=Clohesyomyces aquaticus TaxID=1231657 RepID=A0A1Y2A8D7_9PLEO|nr:hypothetical protein BCR34DRAFT_660118 [Clohesyomyces aquaticus]